MLQYMRLQRVAHDLVTEQHIPNDCIPTSLEEPHGNQAGPALTEALRTLEQ